MNVLYSAQLHIMEVEVRGLRTMEAGIIPQNSSHFTDSFTKLFGHDFILLQILQFMFVFCNLVLHVLK